MAKGNGQLMLLETLKEISAKLDVLRSDMNDGFSSLRGDMNDGFTGVLKITGRHWRDHEERLQAVEAKLGLR